MKNLRDLPRAQRRFQVIDENTWVGSPSVPCGIVRRLAYDQRKAFHKRGYNPYLRVLFGEAGRRGDTWGGLSLEVNGELFHFTAGVKRWPRFHDGAGNLTIEGQKALANGVHGLLSTMCDWRWVQDEADLTQQLDKNAIEEVSAYFRGLRDGPKSYLPMFQSRMWARRWGMEICPNRHNCTTIILEALKKSSGLVVEESMPLPAFDALCRLAGDARSELDNQLNYLLSFPEEQINDLIQREIERSINEFAKGWAPINRLPLPWISGFLR